MKEITSLQKFNESGLGIMINRMSDDFLKSFRDELTRLHRNDFCVCILPKNGKGTFVVDFKEFKLIPGTLLFLYPDQVHRVIETEKIDGWVLFFDNNIIDDYCRSVLEDSLYQGPLLGITKAQKKWMFHLMELLYATSEIQDMAGFHRTAMRSIVVTFICKITALYQVTAAREMKDHSLRSNTIVASFRKLLRQNYVRVKSPIEYASMMNLSLGYLNDTLKTVTGCTVSVSIQEEAITKAQRLLMYSDLRIHEIADLTGFDDPKYFSRIFRKVTNISPAQFRKSRLDQP